MIRAFELAGDRLAPVAPDCETALWWDLASPAPEEVQALERRLGLSLPSRDEMREIEISSRLYAEDGAAFMTAQVPSQTDADAAVTEPVTFVLAGTRLVTIRHTEPRAFVTFPQRAARPGLGLTGAETVLLALLEAIVDRLADILERAGREIDALSRSTFGQKGAETRRGTSYKATLEEIGRKGALTSNLRDSLASLERVLLFLGPRLTGSDKGVRDRLKALVADVRSLEGHAGFVEQKIAFLLDATLGLINIEQNAIIKIVSVAAVVFLPPTLVASIYGMNFQVMPELGWPFGYPFALGMMVLSAVLPFLYFKRRGWL